MNILIVSQFFWPEKFRLNDLAQGLAARGHDVTVLTGKPNYPSGKFYSGYGFLRKSQESYGAINVIRAPVIPRGRTRAQLVLNYLSFILFGSIVGLAKCKRPDVIFVCATSPITAALPAMLLKKLYKSPLLLWVQDLWPESVLAVTKLPTKSIIIQLLTRLVKLIYQTSDYILMTSKTYFSAIAQYTIAQHKLHYFPQTAESFYSTNDVPFDSNLLPLLPQGFRILFSGNIGVLQDMETILQATILLKSQVNIQWIFVGDGSKRRWLTEKILQYHLTNTVCWMGEYPAEIMPHFFSQADIFLVTLKNNPLCALTVPAKIQSYLAAAKPIIASIAGESKRIIEEAGAGFVASPGDAAELARQVMHMYSLSIADRAAMGLKGKQYFDKYFCRDRLLSQLENWMKEAIG